MSLISKEKDHQSNRLQQEYLVNQTVMNKKKRLKMFEKILYPTDFSDVSRKALDYIKTLKNAGGRGCCITHYR
jgi:hypothetical protein